MHTSARLANVLYALALLGGTYGAYLRERIITGEPESLLAMYKAFYGKQEVDSISRDSHISRPSNSQKVILDTYGGVLEAPKKRCALVGSSKHLAGLRRGAEIDNYDMVIRINRLPSEKFFDDFGNRTDVLFLNKIASDGKIAVMGDTSLGGTLNCRHGGPGCAFGSIVFRLIVGNLLTWPTRAPFPVGAASGGVRQAASSLLHRKKIPSTGFVAFVTYATVCQELDLYGFVGDATIDGHNIERRKRHSYELEHSLIRRIANSLPEGTKARTTWAESIDSSSEYALQWFEDHVGKNLSVNLLD